jgi:hypothetical protein
MDDGMMAKLYMVVGCKFLPTPPEKFRLMTRA